LLIQKYFEFLSGLVSWVGDVFGQLKKDMHSFELAILGFPCEFNL